MSKQISDLVVGDQAYVFGGIGSGSAEGVEVAITRVGRTYVYSTGLFGRDRRFLRETGVEAIDSNYKRLLVVDRDAHIAGKQLTTAFYKLRDKMPKHPPEGVTLDDINAAAKLLRVSMKLEE